MIVVIGLSGCGTGLDPAPPFATRPTFPADAAQGTTTWWLYSASELGKEYQERYVYLKRVEPWFDIPLIGLAAAGAGALLFGASTNVIAGIGLGAGTLAVGRTYLNPGGTATVYLSGRGALDCVIDAARPLVKSDPVVSELRSASDNVRTYLRSAENWSASLQGETLDAELANAKNALDAAIGAARDALNLAEAEIDAADAGPNQIATAIGRIEVLVAQGVNRTPVDFATAQSAISSAITASAAQRATLQTARDQISGQAKEAAEVKAREALLTDRAPTPLETTQERTADVVQATDALLGQMPNFVDANAKVDVCSATLTTG
jgi:hypothetical protein